MTPQQQYQLALHCIGGFLIALGAFAACVNWIIFRHQIRFSRGKEARNSSMIGLVGFALPIGCLFFSALRVHALWVWLLDPISAWLALDIALWLWQKLTRSSP